MNSRIYTGFLWHARRLPRAHEFTYPFYLYGLDLDELPELARTIPLFGYNRPGLVSFRDRDYLDGADRPVRQRLQERLNAAGCGDGIARVLLVTSLRYLGILFNPVSFYYCFDAAGGLRCVLAEVNNTFGDRHLYLLRDRADSGSGFPAHYMHPKEFHVSPFNDLRGEYRFTLADARETLDVRIDLLRDGQTVLQTRAWGDAAPLTAHNLAHTLALHPVSGAASRLRIHLQAIPLYFRRKLAFHPRPVPTHPSTIGVARPDAFERFCRARVSEFLGRIRTGCLELTLPDGTVQRLGETGSTRRADIRFHNEYGLKRVVLDEDVGFGDGYVYGDWTTRDLAALLRLLAENHAALGDRTGLAAGLSIVKNRIRHGLRRNSLAKSRDNIHAHYDLSNEFFRLFLDPTMMYSCALFERPEQSLEDAQMNKVRTLLRKARLRPTDHLLEIGSGWGTLAIEAARSTGCRVTSLTLSTEQLELARQRVRDAGLQDRVSIELCDYRKVEGRYDRIISVEMIEAVGHEYFGTFFRRCDELLKPDGLVVIQAITLPDHRYDAYRTSPDWIQKHIFPGGVIPSVYELMRAMRRRSHLFIQHMENISEHYGPTLQTWRENFLRNWPRIAPLGFDEGFRRKWEYYLAYCEAGFRARVLNLMQIVLTRQNNHVLDASH